MKTYLGLFLILIVWGCSGALSTKTNKNGNGGGSIPDQIESVVEYLKNNYKSLQRKWLFNETNNASRSSELPVIEAHDADIELASDLTEEAKRVLIAHAGREVDHAVGNMGSGDKAIAQKEVFKLALKTIFLKAIIEQPEDSKFSFYPIYKAEVEAMASDSTKDPLAKFTSLIGRETINGLVEPLSSSNVQFSVNLKKDILVGLQESLGVTKQGALSSQALLSLKFDVNSWLTEILAEDEFDPTVCYSGENDQEEAEQRISSFTDSFCEIFKVTSGTLDDYVSKINTFLARDNTDFTGAGINENFRENFTNFKTAYINKNIAYLNYSIGTWFYPSSLKNIVKDLKEKAKEDNAAQAKDFVEILDVFVERVTGGHDDDPETGEDQ